MTLLVPSFLPQAMSRPVTACQRQIFIIVKMNDNIIQGIKLKLQDNTHVTKYYSRHDGRGREKSSGWREKDRVQVS